MPDPAIAHTNDTSHAGWRGVLGTALTRCIVPLWLLAGALFKLFSLNPNLLPKPVFELVKTTADRLSVEDFGSFLMFSFRSMVAVELILVGIMFFVPKLARSAAIFILSVFVLVLVAEMWGIYQGRDFAAKGFRAFLEPCGCFGAKSPPALLTFLIDLALLVGVILCRPERNGRTVPGYPISGVALVASLVVGTGLAFGKPQRTMTYDPGEIEQPDPEDPAPTPTPTPTPVETTNGAEIVLEVKPWPDAPARLKPTYFILEKRALGQRLDELELALIINRPMPENINRGRWHLIFYRSDCDHCFEIMNEHFSGDLPAPTLAIEIPDSTGRPYPMACVECLQHTLPKGPDYVVGSPLILTVVDGVIVGVSEDVDKPGALDAVLNAGKPGVTAVDGALILEVSAPASVEQPKPDAPVVTAPTVRPFPPPPSQIEGFYVPEFEKWVGKRFDEEVFARLIRRPLPINPNEGSVCIVYYRVDCDHCQEFLMDHFAGELPMRTIAVAIPDGDPNNVLDMPCDDCILASLIEGPAYVVQTPVLLVLRDGVVQCALVAQEVDDPSAVEACLKK